MDDKEIALGALMLLGATIESHAELGVSTPLFYDSLSLAIEMAKHLDFEELTLHLQTLQIQVGELNLELKAKADILTDKLGDLNELLDNLTSEDI